jgi:YebC/PmpR family DNA-binding regulatory protein
MAGHSKWANIKHRKGAQDKKRAKVFTRALKEISVAVKEGGPDEDSNPRLRLAIQNAKSNNVPKDTIERAVHKASGADADNYEEVAYEGYGPHGIAIYVECTTDNINRTVSSVRSIFNKYGGSLGTNGSLDFIFTPKGVFTLEREKISHRNKEEFELELIEGGVEELEYDGDFLTIYTAFEDFGKMNQHLENLDVETKSAEVQRIPNVRKELDLSEAKSILNIIDKFEDDDDVQNVYHDMELTDELMEAIEAE